MNTRTLGTLTVSEIGMGCMGLSHGYGEIPNHDYSIEAIRRAYDAECTFFDTAEAYGPNLAPENRGHNERLVGEAVEPFRNKVVLATKLHLDTTEVAQAGLEATIRAHLAASLERLRTDHVELYYLHRVNTQIPLEDVARVMARLIDEGLIGGWGLSQVSVEMLDRAHQTCPVTAVQSIYSMVERGLEESVIPYCQARGIGVVAFSPIASGLLAGTLTAQSDFSHADDVRKFVPQLKPENLAANQPIVDLLRQVASAKGATPAQISLAWMLHKWPHVVPIPGSKHQERILENLGAAAVTLTDHEFSQLEDALEALPVAGHRGHVQVEGESMASWGAHEKRTRNAPSAS